MAKELSFEDKMNKLQEIVDLLEQGKITLAESVKLYKEGLELTQKCKEELEKAKHEVKILPFQRNMTYSSNRFTKKINLIKKKNSTRSIRKL